MGGLLLRGAIVPALVLGACVPALTAQCPLKDLDEQIKQLRGQTTFASTDEDIIRNWVECCLAELRAGRLATKDFQAHFAEQRGASGNTAEFVQKLAAQSAQSAGELMSSNESSAAMAAARMVFDFDHPATVPALATGLKSPTGAVRFLCAKGLARRRADLAANQPLQRTVVSALVDAARNETFAAVLAWDYRALSFPGLTENPLVFDAFLAILDARVAARRSGAIRIDGAEVEAFEYLRAGLAALSPEQKEKLVARLAVFFRGAAQRYVSDDAGHQELLQAERTLESIEAILETLTGQAGGVRAALASGGRDEIKRNVDAAATAWVGDAEKEGELNKTPWNVPRGAP